MFKLEIFSIKCENAANADGANDEVMLMVQVDGGPPLKTPVPGYHQLTDGQTWTFGTPPTFYYEHSAYIGLFDHDSTLGIIREADMLGQFSPDPNTISRTTKDAYGSDSSHYKVEYQVTEGAPPETSTGFTLDSDLATTALSALQNWINAGGDATKILDGERDTDTLKDMFQTALTEKDSKFADLISALGSYLPVKAVSLGVMGQAEIFVGIQGGFGLAIDLENFYETSAIYAFGGLAEGIDAGIQGTLAVGLWLEETADIGGIYVGAEVDMDDVAGFTGSAYASRSDGDDLFDEESGALNLDVAKVVFIGVDVGIDDGVEADETYFICDHLADSNYPSFQVGDYPYMAKVTWITCSDQKELWPGMDSVRVTWKVNQDEEDITYGAPIWNDFEMSDSDSDDIHSINTGTIVQFYDSFTFTVWTDNIAVATLTWSNEDDFKGQLMTHVSKEYKNDAHDCSFTVEMKLLAMS